MLNSKFGNPWKSISDDAQMYPKGHPLNLGKGQVIPFWAVTSMALPARLDSSWLLWGSKGTGPFGKDRKGHGLQGALWGGPLLFLQK